MLLVDFQEDFAYHLQMTLEFNNFQVVSLKSWNEALQFLNTSEKIPDLIISNLADPRIAGQDLPERIAEDMYCSRIPFMFLTTRTRPEDITFAQSLGAEEILFLPCNEQNFFSSIRKLFLSRKKYEYVF